MKLADTARRAIIAALVAACVMVVPGIASAAFTDRSSVTASVGTATIAAPTDVAGSYRCQFFVLWEGIRVDISGLTQPLAPRPDLSYVYELYVDGTRVDSATATPSRPAARLNPSKGVDVGTTTWELRVRVKLANWTSPPLVQSLACRAGGTESGTL